MSRLLAEGARSPDCALVGARLVRRQMLLRTQGAQLVRHPGFAVLFVRAVLFECFTGVKSAHLCITAASTYLYGLALRPPLKRPT